MVFHGYTNKHHTLVNVSYAPSLDFNLYSLHDDQFSGPRQMINTILANGLPRRQVRQTVPPPMQVPSPRFCMSRFSCISRMQSRSVWKHTEFRPPNHRYAYLCQYPHVCRSSLRLYTQLLCQVRLNCPTLWHLHCPKKYMSVKRPRDHLLEHFLRYVRRQ